MVKWKVLLVLVVLTVLLIYLFSVGHPWWYGFIMTGIVYGIGAPIAFLLIWWIKR